MSDELLQRARRTSLVLNDLSDYENRSDLAIIAETVDDLIAEIERLRHVIAEHELCHEDGEVTAECFAKSCIAYQIQKFGRSPTAVMIGQMQEDLAWQKAEVERLRTLVQPSAWVSDGTTVIESEQ